MANDPPDVPDIGRDRIVSSLVSIGLVVGVLLLLLVAVLGYVQVGSGYVGVQKSWGAVTGTTLQPGAHFVVPVKDSVQPVEIRPRTYSMVDTQGEGNRARQRDAVVVQTVNGTTVRVDVTIRYRVQEDQSAEFVRQFNTVGQAEERLIRPTVRSRLRDEAAALPTTGNDAIYTRSGREELAKAARGALQEEFSDEALVLEAVQVREVNLPDSVDQVLNEKVQAQQQIEVERNRVEAEQQRKRQEVIRAEAEAESNRVIAESLTQEVLTNRYINSLDESDTIYVPVGTNGLPTYLRVNGSNDADSVNDVDGDVDPGGVNASTGLNRTNTSAGGT
jgi:regulator of protease activity HflC (stomatin/prohibitin superfamily)